MVIKRILSNLQEPNNEGNSNSEDVERQIERRSTRDKRQASYFKDYEKEKTTPMEPHLKLLKAEGNSLKDVKEFQQLVGSLIYLTITRSEISFSVEIVSQFMQCPRSSLLDVARQILRYVKGSLD
uniref:Reverse transcriptase Ty1/copia-type domain-containing protein n=1 Tax=Solanum lycopersicum TaxID=4081 RepID=A0A3Q7I192_SOLLC